jgi:hypothetical protein
MKMAAEANASLLRQHAAVILARQAAMRIIKKQIRAEGRLRLSTIPQAVLNRLAIELVEACPQLVAAAANDPIVLQMTAPRRPTTDHFQVTS